MAIDPRIALMGQQPNFLQTMDAGNRAAAFQNESNNVNQMRNFLRDNGDQVYQGNEQALGQYAQFSPEAALGVRNTRDQMAERQERLKMARAAGARAAANAKISREQAAEAAADMKNLRQLMLLHDDPEAFMQAANTLGYAQEGMTHENAYDWLAMGEGAEAVIYSRLKDLQPEEPKGTDDIREYEYARSNGFGGTFEEWQINRSAAVGGNSDPSQYLHQGQIVQGQPQGQPAATPGGNGTFMIPGSSLERMGNQGQPVGQPQQGEQILDMGKTPEAQILTPGGLQTMAGSPDQREQAAAAAGRNYGDWRSAIKNTVTMDSITLNIKELEDGGMPVTGVWGEARTGNVGRALTGEGAMDYKVRSDQITNAAALADLQEMKKATGAGVGSLTDGERIALGQAVTAISTATGPEESLRALKAYRKVFMDLAVGEGNWSVDEQTNQIGINDSRPSMSGPMPFDQMSPLDLSKVDPNFLGAEELRAFTKALRRNMGLE